MESLVRAFRGLPSWAKYTALWVCVALPVALARDQLPRDMSWVILVGVSAFMLTLYGVHRVIGLMDKSRGAQLDNEIKEQTTGPSRLEFAEKEKEYKKKWLEGIEKLEKSKMLASGVRTKTAEASAAMVFGSLSGDSSSLVEPMGWEITQPPRRARPRVRM